MIITILKRGASGNQEQHHIVAEMMEVKYIQIEHALQDVPQTQAMRHAVMRVEIVYIQAHVIPMVDVIQMIYIVMEDCGWMSTPILPIVQHA